MKIKLFSLMAAVLFMGSLTSMTSPMDYLVVNDCTEWTFDAMDDMLDLGLSPEEAGCVGNWFYAECMGYPVSVSDYESCLR